MAVTKNSYEKAAVWTKNGEVMFIKLSDLSILGAWIPSVTPTGKGMMNEITFSNDESLVILETDHFNPL